MRTQTRAVCGPANSVRSKRFVARKIDRRAESTRNAFSEKRRLGEARRGFEIEIEIQSQPTNVSVSDSRSRSHAIVISGRRYFCAVCVVIYAGF